MDSVLQKLQQTQIEMLCVIDRICKEYNLEYSLYMGTLLGAVRHQGFIPWDDDLDICMTRENYNRFLQVWDSAEHDGYILQNKENAPQFPQSFTKIRKDHTTFLQSEAEAGKYHTGIFVDVFPIDRLPAGKLSRYGFYWNCMRYQLFTREFAPKQNGTLMRLGSALLLKLMPPARRPAKRQKLLRKITACNENAALQMVAVETMDSLKTPFAPDLMEHFITLPFNGHEFMCVADWDPFLRALYGDYMQLPPEQERTWKHHPIIIDFEHNYDELDFTHE